MSHPSVDEILALAVGRQSDASIAEHVETCTPCRQLLALSSGELDGVALDGDLRTVDRREYADRRELHRGGMGRATYARDTRLGREVVIKELLEEYGTGVDRDALRLRFEREAMVTARLQHPSIVAVYEAGRWDDGEPFYAMPMVRGTPLADAIAEAGDLRGRLGLVQNVVAACDAIAYAHSKGVVHRDIKPHNLLIGEFGETVVIDWGLAKTLSGDDGDVIVGAPESPDDGMTELGAGTAAYMSPEQSRGDDPGLAFDVYSLGATLYHVLSGVAPYAEVASELVRVELGRRPPTSITAREPEISAELVAITERAMERDTDKRFATAGELADELRRFLAGRLTETHRYSLGALVMRWIRRHRAVVAVAAVGVVVAAAIAIVSSRRVDSERSRADESETRAALELVRSQGARASQLSTDRGRTLDALIQAVRAAGPAIEAGEAPLPDARQGLADAVTAVPTAVELIEERGVMFADATPTGSTWMVVTERGEMRVWTDGDRDAYARHRVSVGGVVAAALSPDGTRAIAIGKLKTVAVVDLAAGNVVETDIEADDPRTVLWSPGARVIASSGRIVIADATGKVNVLDPPYEQVTSIGSAGGRVTALSMSGDAVIAAVEDGRVLRWERGATEAVEAYQARGELIDRVAASPNRERIAVHTGAVTQVVDAHGDDVWRDAPGPAGVPVAWSNDGRYLVTATDDGTLRVYDEEHRIELSRFAGSGEPVDSFHLLPSGLAISAGRGGAHLWNTGTYTAPETHRRHMGEVRFIDVHRDRGTIASTSVDGETLVWAHDSEGILTSLASPVGAYAVRFDRDGTHIAVAEMGGEVQVAAVDADESRRIANHGAPIFDAVFSADGKTLFAVGTDGRTGIWDVATGEQLHALESEGIAMSLSPDGSRLATMSARGGFIVWEVGTGAEVLRGPGPDDELGTSIAFSPDGASLAVGGERSTVVVDAGTGAELATLHGRPATGLLSPYSPDGNLLALVAGDGAVELYRGTESIGALLGHTRRAVSAAWSADGARLVTASPDGSVRLWEVVEGARLLTIRGATPATFARLAAGDGHVISAFADGTLRVDAVAPRALLDQACAAIERFGDLDAVAPHCSDFADRPPTATRDETD